MVGDRIVYSTSNLKGWCEKLCSLDFPPQVGSVFTASLRQRREGTKDYTLDMFQNYTGYVKRGDVPEEEMAEGDFFRFIVVAVHSKNFHNYFYASPLRRVGDSESTAPNFLDAKSFRVLRERAYDILNAEIAGKGV